MESTLRTDIPDGLKIIETFAYRPGRGPVRLPLHLVRMQDTAARLGFPFHRAAAMALIESRASGPVPLRMRLTLDHDGTFDLTAVPLSPTLRPWRVKIADWATQADNPWLGIKTTNRALYDSMRADMPTGIDEFIFLNTDGVVTEGTITNIFIKSKDGPVLTPPLTCGVLPGILRLTLIDRGAVNQAVLTPDDLRRAEWIKVGNSLRGTIPAVVVS